MTVSPDPPGGVRHLPPDFPPVVTLCGSVQFKHAFAAAARAETLAGRVVLAPDLTAHRGDALHLRRIELADEVLVINVLGRACPKCGKFWADDGIRVRSCVCTANLYDVPTTSHVGADTRAEVRYARQLGRAVRFLEPGHVPADL